MTPTIQASLRSDKRKKPEVKTYRHMTFDEICEIPGHALILDVNEKIVTVKVTSVTRRSSKPDEVVVGCKYGLREFFKVHAHRGHETNEFVVEVEDAK